MSAKIEQANELMGGQQQRLPITEMFPKAQKTKLDMKQIGAELAQRKAKLIGSTAAPSSTAVCSKIREEQPAMDA